MRVEGLHFPIDSQEKTGKTPHCFHPSTIIGVLAKIQVSQPTKLSPVSSDPLLLLQPEKLILHLRLELPKYGSSPAPESEPKSIGSPLDIFDIRHNRAA